MPDTAPNGDRDLYLPESLHAGRAADLPKGKERRIYRALEILPGALSWGTLIFAVLVSAWAPVAASYLIIAFDLYWLLKTVNLSIHHYHNWRRMKRNVTVKWTEHLRADYGARADEVTHLVLLPYYREDETVVRGTLTALSRAEYDLKKIIVVLAAEERAGKLATALGRQMEHEFGPLFGGFLVSVHPADLPGEMPGKGSNIAHAAEEARLKILEPRGLDQEKVLVSAFDIDTVAGPAYFSCLTWHFLGDPDPTRASFQPVPLYNNNIWDVPAFSRVAALSSTYWQMIEQERPERLVTFSSHAVPFATLRRVNYWQRNMVSEDSRIFWNLFFAHGGEYRVVPIAYPVSMDANLASSMWKTAQNTYRQHRRWCWGAENVPYLLYHCLRHPTLPLATKIRTAAVQLEGYWSLATNPLIIMLLGWLPIFLGGRDFNDSVLAYNLPFVTSVLMTVAMGGLLLSAVIGLTLLPPYPKNLRGKGARYAAMTIQWVLVPLHIIVFGSIPGLDAQTRLMLGRYMGFWVTPKVRGASSSTGEPVDGIEAGPAAAR
jgi:cellulose synthase/poly-beta-1,6-N-acetylglucosamine synthase-like glycosyltransferase